MLARGPASIVDLDVTATRLRLDRFLPDTPALGRTGLVVGGLLSLRMRPRAPLRLSADFQSIDFTWGCTGAAPRPVTCNHLRNQMPVRLRAQAGGGPIELQPTRLEAPDSQVLMSGRLQRGTLDARLEGTLGARLLEPLLRKSPIVVAGKVAAKLRAQGPVAAPRFLGSMTVREPRGGARAQAAPGSPGQERARCCWRAIGCAATVWIWKRPASACAWRAAFRSAPPTIATGRWTCD